MINFKVIFFFTMRLFTIKFRDKFDLFNILGVPVLIGASTAFILKYVEDDIYTLQDNDKFVQFLFLSIIIIIFISLTNSVREFISNKVYIIKEKRSGVSLLNYFIATFLVLSTIAFIQVFLYVIVSSYIIELRDSFWVFFVWLYLCAIGATSFGLFISSIVNSEITATMTIPLILIPQIILGGGMITFKEINKNIFVRDVSVEDKNKAIPSISQVMISKWATEGIYVDLNRHLNKYAKFKKAQCNEQNKPIDLKKRNILKSETLSVKEKQKKLLELDGQKIKCNALALYSNAELSSAVKGAKDDFNEAFNYEDVTGKFLLKKSYMCSMDDIKDIHVTSAIVNTFASPLKCYGGYFIDSVFLSKVVIFIYSLFFLTLSYLFLRKV